MTLTPEKIAELRTLAEKAIKGPWYADTTSSHDGFGRYLTSEVRSVEDNRVVVEFSNSNGTIEQLDETRIDTEAFANAALIAASREAVPQLLDEVERLRLEMHQGAADIADALLTEKDAEIARLRKLLGNSTDAIDSAIDRETNGYSPDWDWLCSTRELNRLALRPKGEHP